jgi:ribosomal protein S18 acetylase RimI-like enzyme
MFSRLYHFVKGPHPLHPSVLADRLSPLTFRRFTSEDLPQCLDLYALNEPGRFPKGVAQQYEESLKRGSSYFLVTESEGQILASGGVSYFCHQDIATLCFGLVRPSHHGKGIGTALLLARLALLMPTRQVYHVYICAVEDSIGFYRRFGFRYHDAWTDAHGELHPSGHLVLTDREICQCRAKLREHRIEWPSDENQVPLNTEGA